MKRWPRPVSIGLIALSLAAAPASSAQLKPNVRFASSLIVRGGEPLTSVAAGDFNGDGRLDAAFAVTSDCGGCTLGSHPALLIAQGDGRGRFGPFSRKPLPDGFDAASRYVRLSLVSVRLRRRGHIDLAVGSAAGTIMLFRGNGRGRFTQGPRFALRGPVLQVVAADLNRDGNADLAAVVFDPATQRGHVAVLSGNGHGGFSSPHVIDAAENPSALAIADLNGDHRPDLVLASNTPPGVSILLARRHGGYRAPRHFKVIERSYLVAGDVAAADVTAAGHADVIVPGWLLQGDGRGQLGAPRPIPVAGPFAVGDFNGDRRVDVAGVRTRVQPDGSSVPLVRILLSEGHGNFEPPLDLPAIAPECCLQGMLEQTLATDLNQDGRPDLLSAGLINTGSGTQFGFAALQLNRGRIRVTGGAGRLSAVAR